MAIKVRGQDPNVNAYYLCEPSASGATFDCKSGRQFHQYDRQLLAGEECSYGVSDAYVETNWHGSVTRIQYVCSTPPVGGFPAVPSPDASPSAVLPHVEDH